MPLLNKAINKLTKKEMLYGVSVIVLFGSASILFKADPFNLAEGYSMIWLIFMYFIGALFVYMWILTLLTRRKSFTIT